MLSTLNQYTTDLWQRMHSRLLVASGFTLAGALTEGLGLLLLLPVLQLVSGDQGAVWAAWVRDVLSAQGLTSTFSQIAILLGAAFLLMALRTLIVRARVLATTRLNLAFVDSWRIEVFRVMAGANWRTLAHLQHAEGQSAMMQDVARLAIGTNQFLNAGVALIVIAVQCTIAFAISPSMAILVLGTFLIVAAAIPTLLRRAAEPGRRLTEANRRQFGTLIEFLGILKLIKIERREEAYTEIFIENTKRIRAEVLTFTAIQANAQAILELASTFLICIVLLAGLFWLETNITVLVAFVVIIARLRGPIFGLAKAAQQIANMIPAFDNLERILSQMKDGTTEPAIDANEVSTAPTGPLSVEFDAVSFTYPGKETHAVHELAFVIDAGTTAALVGPSGVGKSTALDLMAGLQSPDSGRVRLGGRDANIPYPPGTLAYVPQDVMLIEGSLRENLCWGRGTVADKQIEAALQAVGAEQLMARLPEGLDANIGHSGQRLSGGERQRLCIARALIGTPRLLILDEATSALDRASEAAIFRAIAERGSDLTCVVVTHREIDPDFVDQVIEL